MSEAVIVGLLAMIPALVGPILVYQHGNRALRQAMQDRDEDNERRDKEAENAARAVAQKVEAEAYERARKLYEDGIRQLESVVDRLKDQVKDEQDVSLKLRRQVNELESTVYALRQQLINAGIALAPKAMESRQTKEGEGWTQL